MVIDDKGSLVVDQEKCLSCGLLEQKEYFRINNKGFYIKKEKMMDPISLIVGALVAGASSALKDTTNQMVKDAYQALKCLVIQHWKSKMKDDVKTEDKVGMLFEELERDPESFKKPLERKLNEIMPHPDTTLINQAQKLEKLLKEAGYFPGKYAVATGSNNQGVQIGDDNTQTNTFN